MATIRNSFKTFSKLEPFLCPKHLIALNHDSTHGSSKPGLLSAHIHAHLLLIPHCVSTQAVILPHQLRSSPSSLSQTHTPLLLTFNLVVQQDFPLKDFQVSHCVSCNYVLLSSILSSSFPTKLWAFHLLKSGIFFVSAQRHETMAAQ